MGQPGESARPGQLWDAGLSAGGVGSQSPADRTDLVLRMICLLRDHAAGCQTMRSGVIPDGWVDCWGGWCPGMLPGGRHRAALRMQCWRSPLRSHDARVVGSLEACRRPGGQSCLQHMLKLTLAKSSRKAGMSGRGMAVCMAEMTGQRSCCLNGALLFMSDEVVEK